MSGKGFEPSTLWLRARCANQAALTAHIYPWLKLVFAPSNLVLSDFHAFL